MCTVYTCNILISPICLYPLSVPSPLSREQATALVVFVLPLLLLCCLYVFAAVFREPDLSSSSQRPMQQAHRIGTASPPPSQRHIVPIYKLTQQGYCSFMERGVMAVVLATPLGYQLLHVAAQHLASTVPQCDWFHLPLQSRHCPWLEELLSSVEEMDEGERSTVLDTVSRGGSVVMMIVVRQRRLYLLPHHHEPTGCSSAMEDTLGLGPEDGEQSADTQSNEHRFVSLLHCWLDRVMDGSQRTYRVTEWPHHLQLQ